jgi:inhibitor of KinA sporulation pathway (predicted exonuclease)
MHTHYLVIDLEATCANDGSVPPAEMETIEIGAVLVDGETLSEVGTFSTFVRPVRHPVLTEFCQTLTTIRQAQVDGAPLFPEALAALCAWASPLEDVLFCSWGRFDRSQLEERDCAYHQVPYPFGTEHLNLKARFAERQGLRKELGVSSALKRVGLHFNGTEHRGLDDAQNIAKLLPYIVDPV